VPDPAPTKSGTRKAVSLAGDFAIGAAGTVAGGEFLQNHESSSDKSTDPTNSTGPTGLTNSTNPTDYYLTGNPNNPTQDPTSYYSTTNPNNPNNPTDSTNPTGNPNYGLQDRALVHGEEALSLFGRMLDELD
jgi:hypothetical protein